MVIPPDMIIEAAVDMLPLLSDFDKTDLLHELSGLGDPEIAKVTQFAKGSAFSGGYLLGVMTMIAFLQGNPLAVKSGVAAEFSITPGA